MKRYNRICWLMTLAIILVGVFFFLLRNSVAVILTGFVLIIFTAMWSRGWFTPLTDEQRKVIELYANEAKERSGKP